MKLHLKYKTLLDRNEINTPLRLAHFFSQLEHESNLLPISESLNYSYLGLMKTFPKYFPTELKAKSYQRNPSRIASYVYANRMGNGSESSQDGWKYRGRGFIQITGKNNYKALSDAMGIDYINNPDLLLQEADAMISALWYWKVNNLNSRADKDDIDTVSDIINLGRSTERYGDANGFKDRLAKLKKYKDFFKV